MLVDANSREYPTHLPSNPRSKAQRDVALDTSVSFREYLIETNKYPRQSISNPLDGRNPQNQDVEGGRTADSLVLYDPVYGNHTGTNAYGCEAVVADGIVIRLGGNNLPIPDNGFVISGHGAGMTWILENLELGDEIEVSGPEVVRHRTIRSTLWRMEYYTRIIKQLLKNQCFVGTQSIHGSLEKLTAEVAVVRESLRIASRLDESRLQTIEARARELYLSLHAPRSPEYRGVWLRLATADPDAIERQVERLARAGFNLVFPETVYYGRTIYPAGADSPLGQWEEFQGRDPLATLLDAAHRHGMQVHAWCHVFFVGFADSPLVARYPDWLGRDRCGRVASVIEKGYHFFQPTHPEAREFLCRVFEDLTRRYPLDGFQFDYIRYCTSEPLEAGFDYSPAARQAFLADADRAGREAKDPLRISPETDPGAWEAWCRFRQQAVTSFVDELSGRLRGVRAGLSLSAAVFPLVEESVGSKMQDWGEWARSGRLDFLCPMIYVTGVDEVDAAMRIVGRTGGGRIPICAGLGPFLGLPESLVVDQVDAARWAGGDGVAFFSADQVSDRLVDALRLGVFSSPAALPRPGDADSPSS